MLPTYFLELQDTTSSLGVMQKYFDNQYPDTEDCITLDKQILDLQKDVDLIITRINSNYKECNCTVITKIPCNDSTIACFNGFKTAVDPDYTKGNLIRSKAKIYLEKKINEKKNKQTLLDCRNKIETTRQDETAQIFTETSASAENRILKQTKTKQYVLAGVGAVVVLTALTIFLMKRKK